eukprot:CAMPEP_0115853716 /NCGR_PEP_ID=MMETSP0287-20121206/13648_1 /TAXON_ID=412157 /ORGANISM="Chrysochromulina rotalis, Strain UIO044" /LENGTH=129 /DNA_ID=CAMNT_0003307803 /DNA_START=543 /DNA_END=928 /DNA_ORIENTATION=-
MCLQALNARCGCTEQHLSPMSARGLLVGFPDPYSISTALSAPHALDDPSAALLLHPQAPDQPSANVRSECRSRDSILAFAKLVLLVVVIVVSRHYMCMFCDLEMVPSAARAHPDARGKEGRPEESGLWS